MRSRLVLTLAAAFALHDPAAVPAQPLTLELRVFLGAEEVTAQTRATLHRAGDRGEPLLNVAAADGRVIFKIDAGIYDVQAIHEREGRVLNIRWANRLVVMPYPDESGHHLEVINYKNGFGALQVREPDGSRPDVALFDPGKRDKPVASPIFGREYALFVVRAGSYDLRAQRAGKSTWYPAIEVPLDRTRLWVTP
jgi:hypothetical protein